VLYCASHRLLISADALWQNGFGVIFPELEGESGFAEQRAILERIASLDVDVVLPGHGPLFTNIDQAIERAHRRLDHLGSDPARNARHATKVLLKFLLLEHEQLALDAVPALLDTIPLIDAANRRYIGMPADELARWAVDELVRAGAARIDSPTLTVPHPRMRQRAFVLRPLADIAPALVSAQELQAVSEQVIEKI
jgi:glyoxylase-like metal-dependent hydrolase (beta-lactamase superfamily II)